MTHRIRLVPNKKQREYFFKAAGVARFAYNWALAEWERRYALGEPRSELLLRRRLNAIKDEQFPWMREVTKNAPQQAIKNLGRAYAAYFVKTSAKPRFKRKGIHDSFRADNGPSPCDGRHDAVQMAGKRIKLPRIGWVKGRETLRFNGQILSVAIVRQADRWFAIVAVRMPDHVAVGIDGGAAGCDLGITTFATVADSDGCRKISAPAPLGRFAARVRRLSRSLSRKQIDSRNRAKAKTKLSRLHARINDIRHDAMHKLTTDLCRAYSTIGLETLNIRGMQRNRRTAFAVSDAAFGEFRRQVLYKSQMRGSTVVLAHRWFPSSKRCSACGVLNQNVRWHVRSWTCAACHSAHDRDENAARNLYLAASSAVNACGAEGAGRVIRLGETGRNEARRVASAIRNGAEIARYPRRSEYPDVTG